MARKTKAPTQPSMADERELERTVDNEKDYAEIRGRKIALPFLNQFGLHKISRIMTDKGGNELVVGHKCLAAARLNGYFKIKLFWSILWRWYAYVRAYTDIELTQAVSLIKKKADVAMAVYSINTTLLIGMRETIMKMNREEAVATHQELFGGKAGKSAKSDRG